MKINKEATPPTLDFIEHIDDWLEYIATLLDITNDIGTQAKYRRQIKYLLKFRMGLNVNISHNKLLLHYYSNMAQEGGDDIRLKPEITKANDTDNRKPKISAEAQLKVDEMVDQASEFVSDLNMRVNAGAPIQDGYEDGDPAYELIKKALASNDLFFLQGPPGTGKTMAIVEIVLQTLAAKPNARVLICSETHVAVDNALDRLSKICDSRLRSQIMRYPSYAITEFESELTKETDAKTQIISAWNQARSYAPALTDVLYLSLEQGKVKDGVQMIPRWQYINAADKKQIIGVTCNQIDHLIDEDSEMFDLVLIDECSKATMPEWLMAMSVGNKCVLVGDHKQLPPTFCEEESTALKTVTKHKEKLIRNGVIDRIFVNLPDDRKGTLEKQYRMLPHIGQFISEHFYQGKLQHYREKADHKFEQFGWCTYSPKAVRYPLERGGVLENPIECDIILDCLQKMVQMRSAQKSEGKPTRKLSVAVITPYRAQCRLLNDKIEAENFDKAMIGVEVATVDAFQGRQADVVFFSFVRTWGSATFYADARRMNVAISRARDGVYLVGDKRYIYNVGKRDRIDFLASLARLKELTRFN
jgi:ATP-dependent RNA/DNA helicase IGHMBP2